MTILVYPISLAAMRHFSFAFSLVLALASGAWAKDYRVIVLPCGGATGIIPAVLIAHLEDETQFSITELVDELWGTSAGAITAALLATPDPQTKKPFRTGHYIVRFFETHFASFLRARAVHSSLTNEIGAHLPIKNTRPALRILTAAADVSQNRKLNLLKTYTLLDFSSDGKGASAYTDATLVSVVAASSNVYPYVHFTPTQVAVSPTETVSAIDPASFYAPGVGEPTTYFLKQVIKELSAEDTLSVYFLGNAFVQSSSLGQISSLLMAQNKTFQIYSDHYPDTLLDTPPVQVKIFNVIAGTDVAQMMDQAWNDYFDSLSFRWLGWTLKTSYRLTQFSIANFYHFSSFLLGESRANSWSNAYGGYKRLAAANLLAAGAASASLLKEKAQEIIATSPTFQLIQADLKMLARQKQQIQPTPPIEVLP